MSLSLLTQIQLFIFLITLAIYITFLVYLFKLENIGCKCALNWRRQYIIAFIFISIVWNIIHFLKPSLSKNGFFAFIILFLMFIAFTIQYVNNLKRQKCECSKEMTRDIMYVYSWIMVSLLCLAVLFAFIYAFSKK